MKKKLFSFIFSIQLILLLFSTSCRKDSFITDTGAELNFSSTSILFDTVFTTVGSVTKQLIVHNPYKQKIKISFIRLAGGTNSPFRINVDGVAATEVDNIEIKPKDSLYVFIKVTVNPNNSNSPLIVSDSILFETNGNLQTVKLEAWGQNAYYYTPNLPVGNPWFSIIKCNDTWINDKPHVIYGYAVVDSACTLTIKAGTKVYIHKGGVLWVYKDGTLNVEGTLGNTVIFQGDRLEPDYANQAGQWGKIWLSQGSKNNEINYAVIKNGYIGIHIDTTTVNPTQPTLRIENSIIENMGTGGLLAQDSWVIADNCVFANCATFAVDLNIGGNYDFKHCTIGNYWNYSTRQTQSLVLNNYYVDINQNTQHRDLVKANFGNCIVYGALTDEILLDNKSGALFNYNFDHCLLRSSLNSNTSFLANCESCVFNNDPAFNNTDNNDYTLSTGSAAINKGLMSIADYVPFDILRHNRTDDIAPDIGAYEKK